MGNLVTFAERELELVNCEEPERTAILEMVRIFEDVSDSAGQAIAVIAILERLLKFQPLTPLTSNPDEWMLISDEPCWQSKRRASTFSRDEGQTWYDIDDPALNNGDVRDRTAGNWGPAYLGHNLKPNVVVRVKFGAYDRGAAARVNGMPGRVTAVRHGVVAVVHENGDTYNHSPSVLEVLKT